MSEIPWIGYGGPSAKRVDPETSHLVAIGGPKRGTNRWKMLMIHAYRPDGLTDYELGLLYEGPNATVQERFEARDEGRKRRADLFRLGFIEDSGLRRKSPLGKEMVVWRISAKGKAFVKPWMKKNST